jgi:cytochrome-b5 reductase
VKDVQKRKIIRRDDTISWQEVALHKSAENCWIVIDGKVYDPTYYLDEHPGGANKIMEWAGQDATKGFKEAKHSMDAIIKTD